MTCTSTLHRLIRTIIQIFWTLKFCNVDFELFCEFEKLLSSDRWYYKNHSDAKFNVSFYGPLLCLLLLCEYWLDVAHPNATDLLRVTIRTSFIPINSKTFFQFSTKTDWYVTEHNRILTIRVLTICSLVTSASKYQIPTILRSMAEFNFFAACSFCKTAQN